MDRKLNFLCGFFENLCFVYGVKDSQRDWHYFEEGDCIIDKHGSLPADIKNRIRELRKVSTISITLDAGQVENYLVNDKFVFNGKELKTYLGISRRADPKTGPTSDDLVFVDGESDPAIFLDRFERCMDVKTNGDKLYKIRGFVSEEHKPEFSKFFFEGDWDTAREAFLKKYSYNFAESRRSALDFHFNADTSLRSFVNRKMNAISSYTSLKLNCQLEMILAELPSEISCLFTRHLKIGASKINILEFCDYIQEFVDGSESSDASGNRTLTQQFRQHESDVVQDLSTFEYTSSDDETDFQSCEDQSSVSSKSSSVSRKRGRSVKSRDQGGPSKIVRVVAEGSQMSQKSLSSKVE